MSYANHMITRIETSCSNNADKIEQLHTLFMLEMESTASIIFYDGEAENVEKFFDYAKRLILAVPNGALQNDVFSRYREEFLSGLDEYIVQVYRGEERMSFFNTTRALLHYADCYYKDTPH